MDRILECVPNFSEGRDASVIERIAAAIESVTGVRLLNIDPGPSANRTVMTFAGEPEAVAEAAFRAVARAGELIDMRIHRGEHPRIGATDVLPLVPVRGITLAEAAAMARKLAERISGELGIPTYTYEAAAFVPARRDLAHCRHGEYEGLKDKIATAEGRPDFGDACFGDMAARAGATVVGARDFLIAVNFNLNTPSVDIAHDIALDIRERGRARRTGDPLTGPIVRGPDGKPEMIPGRMAGTKAIGWYIEDYGIAQVSMNIVDIDKAPLHLVYEEVGRAAAARGVRVTGTEIIGLVPLKVLTGAGRYFLGQNGSPAPEQELIAAAVRRIGLGELRPFDPRKRVIEYLLEE